MRIDMRAVQMGCKITAYLPKIKAFSVSALHFCVKIDAKQSDQLV